MLEQRAAAQGVWEIEGGCLTEGGRQDFRYMCICVCGFFSEVVGEYG